MNQTSIKSFFKPRDSMDKVVVAQNNSKHLLWEDQNIQPKCKRVKVTNQKKKPKIGEPMGDNTPPHLLGEFAADLNLGIDLKHYSQGSNKKIWWRHNCSCGEVHEWCATIKHRNRSKSGCPLCAKSSPSSKICKCQSIHGRGGTEMLVHYMSGSNETPADQMHYASGKSAKWVCTNDHEGRGLYSWKTNVCRYNGCRVCNELSSNHLLKVKRPDIFALLDPENNKDVDLGLLRLHSGKTVVYSCTGCKSCGLKHKCEGKVDYISRLDPTTLCSLCSPTGKKPCPCQSLQTLFPDLMKEWSPANKSNPLEIRPNTRQSAKWICSRHGTFMQRIVSRTRTGCGCAICSDSIGEKTVMKVLKQLRDAGIIANITRQKKFRSGLSNHIAFDFSFTLKNGCKLLVIEFDGRQHFVIVSFGSKKGREYIKNKFISRVRMDLKKSAFLMENGRAHLLRIAYEIGKRNEERIKSVICEFIEKCKVYNVNESCYMESHPELYSQLRIETANII